jgi:hypothetical protein
VAKEGDFTLTIFVIQAKIAIRDSIETFYATVSAGRSLPVRVTIDKRARLEGIL